MQRQRPVIRIDEEFFMIASWIDHVRRLQWAHRL